MGTGIKKEASRPIGAGASWTFVDCIFDELKSRALENRSDKRFADFKTPEEFFLREAPAPFEWGAADPSKVLQSAPKPSDETYHSDVSS